MEKGIPWVSFVYREGDGAVFLRPRPVSAAGDRLGEPLLAGKEILYRVDYLEKGKIRRTAGILSARKEAEGFFEKMDRDITDGLTKAGSREFYIFLKIHFILCLLEEYVGKRKALAEKWRREKVLEEKMCEAERLYCGELLDYVETARKMLNESPERIVLPLFPERGMAAVRTGT